MAEVDQTTLRDQLVAFGLRQGPSFVVLILILFGIWHFGNYVVTEGITRGIDQITRGYREIQESHTENLERVIAAFEREQSRDSTLVGLVREVVENRDILKQTHALLVELHAHGEEMSLPTNQEEDSP